MRIVCIIIFGSMLMAAAMIGAWDLTRRTHNGGLVDIVWTYALALVAIIFCLAGFGDDNMGIRPFIAAGIIALWAGRLGASLWRRNVGGPEDARYTELRTKWGKHFLPRLFGFLMVQAAAAILLALAVMLAAHNPYPLGTVDIIAIVWMLAALGGSLLSDNQLSQFKKDPANKGKICDVGLWSMTRHPNYFFEVSFWTGWVVMALSGGWWPGALAFIAPAFMYWLLRYVSGVPMVEELMARHYGEAFQNYCQRVPVFFPRLLIRR